MMRKLVIILICCIYNTAALFAMGIADNFHFTHFKSADGLPHQQIQAMAFDHDGRLWIGTRNGLASYDGYGFTTYYHNPGDPNSLPHNFVLSMFVDSRGTVWISTENGMCRYLPSTDSFEKVQVDERRIFCICETQEGNIICGGGRVYLGDGVSSKFQHMPRQRESDVRGIAVSHDNRVYITTDDAVTYYDSKMQSSTQVDLGLFSSSLRGNDGIAPLIFDSRGRMWVSLNGNGVMCYDDERGERVRYDSSRLTSGTVRAIAEDSHGNIWLGTERGINIINPSTGAITQITQDLVNPTKLNDNAIYCIVPDRNGNIWLGTYFGGINLLTHNYNQFSWTAPGYDPRSLRGKAIRRIVEPTRGELWLASEDGGINILDMESGNVRVFDRIPDIGPNIHELYFDQENGDIWIGTFLNGLYRYNVRGGAIRHYMAGGNGLMSTSVFTIVKQKPADGGGRDRLWIGTTLGLRYYDPDSDTFSKIDHTVLDNDFIYSLLVDNDGNLWVGTVNFGLYRVDRRTGDVNGWSEADPSDPDGFHDHYITALLEDSDGRIFIGTNNGGLYYFEPGNLKEVKRLGDGGATFGTVCALTTDGSGKVWMSTSNGLFSIEPGTLHLHHYTVADGLPENQFNFNSALEASDGRMYFGTVNGLVSFTPDLTKKYGKPREVHFANLLINGKEVTPRGSSSPLQTSLDLSDELKLDFRQSRQFGIGYGVIDPERASSTLYQVKVDGIDREWRDVGKLRRFSAMELNPGTYRLNVRASSNPEDWESAPVRTLTIKIAPPIYRSGWAYLLYLLVICAIAYFGYKLFNIRMREKQEVRMSQIDKAKSEELNRDKMEFFTNISHELKTPLSLILAPLKYLEQNQELTSDSRKRLNVAIANTNKMVGLIDELVTFNRVENGNFQLYLQKGNPLTYIEKVTQFFYETAEERKLSLHIYTENNGEEIWYSTTYVERILNNLLSNAIKYTPAGGEVNVRAAIVEEPSGNPRDGDQIYLTIEVRDSGIGIAPEETDNIFKKYYQTKRGYNTDSHGWGIGLATVRKLVEMHRGSIEVESKVGEGSVFRVRLLVTPGAFDPKSYISSASESNPLPSYRSTVTEGMQPPAVPEYAKTDNRISILLVEDNPELLAFLSETFSRSYNVYTATNGVEALKITSEHPVDIVVSDVMMPEMDGIELCNRLKNDLSTSHIPVILLTAKNDQHSTMLGFESGAEAYVVKPFDPQILELRVKNILRVRRRFIKSIIEASEPIEETTEEMPTFNKFDKDFLARINTLIEENMDNSQFSIADITKEFGISRSLLHIKMKSFANASMTDYIRKRRMARACELMRQGYNVSETAYRTGYADPNYFTKVFKKEFSCTPSEFIASLQDSAQQ